MFPRLSDSKVTKKSRGGIGDLIFWGLISILALKILGLLKGWFNIDPKGVSFSVDVAEVISLALFALLWSKFDGIRTTIADQGQRLARLEGRVSTTKSK